MSAVVEWAIVLIIIAIAIAFFVQKLRRRNDNCCDCPLNGNCRKQNRKDK